MKSTDRFNTGLRAAHGARFFDTSEPPGWFNKVDIETLAVHHYKRCGLGQLHGDYWRGKKLHKLTEVQCIEFGFQVMSRNISDAQVESELLDAAMAEQIIARRTAANLLSAAA